jgi:hypothetical protein
MLIFKCKAKGKSVRVDCFKDLCCWKRCKPRSWEEEEEEEEEE